METISTSLSGRYQRPSAVSREQLRLPTLGETVLDEGDFCSNPLEKQEQVLLNQVTRHYQHAMRRNLRGQQYLSRFGLNDPELIKVFKLGLSDRTLCHKLGDARTVAGGTLRGRLQRLGILRPSGHEHFRGSLVVPIPDAYGNTVDMWARKLSHDQRYGTPLQLSLFDPPRGVFNIQGLKGQDDVILCGGVLDAMTLWRHGFKNVTATLGVRGLTPEHLDAMQQFRITRVVIAFERTKFGDGEARLVAQALDALRIECLRLDLPRGLNVNSYARLRYPIMGSLADMLRAAHPFRQNYTGLQENMVCQRIERNTP